MLAVIAGVVTQRSSVSELSLVSGGCVAVCMYVCMYERVCGVVCESVYVYMCAERAGGEMDGTKKRL